MISLFETTPKWKAFSTTSGLEATKTLLVKKYWETVTQGGGPLTKELATPSTSGIVTPILDQIKTHKVFGYYQIDMVQMDTNSKSFIDIWILATRQ